MRSPAFLFWLSKLLCWITKPFTWAVKLLTPTRRPINFGALVDAAKSEEVAPDDLDSRLKAAARASLEAQLPDFIGGLQSLGFEVERLDDDGAAFVIHVAGRWDGVLLGLKLSGRLTVSVSRTNVLLGMLVDESADVSSGLRNEVYRDFEQLPGRKDGLPPQEALESLAIWIMRWLQRP